MKLLLIEDDRDIIDSLKEVIEKKNLASVRQGDLEDSGFGEAEEKIRSMRPEVVILDIFDGEPAKQMSTGAKSLDFIWNEHFCPVIVYSAMPEKIKNDYRKHPFVHYVKKGADSEEKVLGKLEEIVPYVESLKNAEEYVYKTFSSVMKRVAPYAFHTYQEDEERRTVAIRQAARRRLAAQMDELSGKDGIIAPWEQYVFPPISREIRLGDILKKRAAASDDPNAFRLVLTPSCDLAGEKKVEDVLVARCCPVEEALAKAVNIRKINSRNKDKVKSFLSAGHSNGIIPLPELAGLVPSMSADLRSLKLVPVQQIENPASSEKTKYERIASLDSPFREMVSWAYLQVAGRPGLPERDINAWLEEVRVEIDAGKD